VFSLLKRWILATHQGGVGRKHLQVYLDEYTFRFNRRNAKNLTHSFQRLTEGAVREQCAPYLEACWQVIGQREDETEFGVKRTYWSPAVASIMV